MSIAHLRAFCGCALAEQQARLALGLLALPRTKSGQRRMAQVLVTVDDNSLAHVLAWYQAWAAPADLVADLDEPGLRQFFERANRRLGAETIRYRPYSLRRGGVTHDYLALQTLPRASLRGGGRISRQHGFTLQTAWL